MDKMVFECRMHKHPRLAVAKSAAVAIRNSLPLRHRKGQRSRTTVLGRISAND
jgi:hypothetical protein